jgi:hypothetical protein
MPYTFIVQQLWPVADGAKVVLRNEWGMRNLVEGQKAHDEIDQVPAFHAQMPDHHTLWVEVSDRPYPKHLDAIVADCTQHCLPVRLVVAVPAGQRGGNFNEDMARARQKGVGIIEVDDHGGGRVTAHPLSLALAGVHPIPKKDFPDKYRYRLSQAEGTFRDGNPVKACDDIFAVIEALSRNIAKKTFDKGLWRAHSNPPRFHKDPWESVLNALIRNLDTNRCRLFGQNILHRVLGVTALRNEVVHDPTTRAELIRRDRRLRTRFEDATNLLLDLITAAKPLKL